MRIPLHTESPKINSFYLLKINSMKDQTEKGVHPLDNPEIIMTGLTSIIASNLTEKQKFLSRFLNIEFSHPNIEGLYIIREKGTGYELTRLSDGKKFDCELFEDHFYPAFSPSSSLGCEYTKITFAK